MKIQDTMPPIKLNIPTEEFSIENYLDEPQNTKFQRTI